MDSSNFITINYEHIDRQVCWRGVSLAECDNFARFLTSDVAARLNDEEADEHFESHLRGLANTGFAQESLKAILGAELPEERTWAIGEAIAESYLARELGLVWPWNMARDKRTPKASLPGADLVGFEKKGGKIRLALGEVKTSSQKEYPPNVMYGRSGITHQIDGLATNLTLIAQLLKWLLLRCKGTQYESSYNSAIALLLENGNKEIAVFGVLIRDTTPNELDLKARAAALANVLLTPTTCQLLAVHLPCQVTTLPARISGGGS